VSTTDEKHMGLARVYGDALLTLAAARGEEDEVWESLEGLATAIEDQPDFELFLDSPLVDDAEKRAFLERLLRGRTPDLLVDGLQVVRRKGRLGLLRAIARAYREAWMRLRKKVEVDVVTAVPLAEELRRTIAAAASRRSGREAVLRERVEPDLLGGLVVKIGDEKFDASVARELAILEQRLLARASAEILSGKEYMDERET
jgi:F-type H+-transporting ATPase subunit delta